jgi:heptosyltransferase II
MLQSQRAAHEKRLEDFQPYASSRVNPLHFREMKENSHRIWSPREMVSSAAGAPILVIPYMWIGDFVRCHTVVKLLEQRCPGRPIDLLTTSLCAPLVDYMPGVRQGILWDLPRSRLALAQQARLARTLRAQGYSQALIMPRTWKSAVAPLLAGIPQRTGFAGELRLCLVNDLRWGERKLPRMVDRCAALAMPKHVPAPVNLPLPQLVVPQSEVLNWRERIGLTADRPVVAFAPGAVGPSKRWPSTHYAALADRLASDGMSVWVLGGPNERSLAADIAAGGRARDLTGDDLRNAILALAAADVAVSNDSGLLHVAAAVGTPTIGVFGPTSPWHWAPLNPLAAVIETEIALSCRPCHKPTCRLRHHRCMYDIEPARVVAAIRQILTAVPHRQRNSV